MAEPFRAQVAAALARRAEPHQGALRQALDARVAALQLSTTDIAAPAQDPPRPSPLRTLLRQLEARRAQAPVAPAGIALDDLRRTWNRLQAEQRLAQSRAALPRNAGPLNSQHLMHRSLALMRELSPGYFERFVAYADTLLWLEQLPPRKPTIPRNPGASR